MNRSSPETAAELSGSLEQAWHRFSDLYDALRPDLYRYCRYLSKSPWDAEDLVQDTLARAFVTLAQLGEPPGNPRAWLLRVASNLFIDQCRRQRSLPAALEAEVRHEPRDTREAAGTLLVRLSPQERAAVVLKQVFDLSLDEIAEALATTVGAVKAALARGRGKLSEEPPVESRRVVPAALNTFCDAFNARDVDRLTALLLDSAAVEVVGVHSEYGAEKARNGVLYGMLYGSQRMANAATEGGMDGRFVQGVLPDSPRLELRLHRDEPLLLSWYAHEDGEAVRAITRVELEEGRIARLRNYFFTPEFLREVCAELGVPCKVNGTVGCRNEEG